MANCGCTNPTERLCESDPSVGHLGSTSLTTKLLGNLDDLVYTGGTTDIATGFVTTCRRNWCLSAWSNRSLGSMTRSSAGFVTADCLKSQSCRYSMRVSQFPHINITDT
jgi:hypothetical protein